LFIIGHMGLFVYTQKGSIISMVDLPTTEIIERIEIKIIYIKRGGHSLFFDFIKFCKSYYLMKGCYLIDIDFLPLCLENGAISR
ncbi:TPA: hypothetical protein ACGO84_001043, partial [Streptococcus suis]